MVQQLCRNATVLPLKEIWDALSFCLSEHCTKCTAGIRCRVLRTANIYNVSTERIIMKRKASQRCWARPDSSLVFGWRSGKASMEIGHRTKRTVFAQQPNPVHVRGLLTLLFS